MCTQIKKPKGSLRVYYANFELNSFGGFVLVFSVGPRGESYAAIYTETKRTGIRQHCILYWLPVTLYLTTPSRCREIIVRKLTAPGSMELSWW